MSGGGEEESGRKREIKQKIRPRMSNALSNMQVTSSNFGTSVSEENEVKHKNETN